MIAHKLGSCLPRPTVRSQIKIHKILHDGMALVFCCMQSTVVKVATYDDFVSLTRVTRAPAAAVPSLQSGGKTSPRFGVASHPSAVCHAPASSRPPAYVPYASMAMTPSDIMHQQICYQGIRQSGQSHL